MIRLKEIAKFGCGFETFHAVMHAYLWSTNTTIYAAEIVATPAVHSIGMMIAAVVAVLLGVYAWTGMMRRIA